MLSSDYNVLRSTVLAMNNFIQLSYCQSVVAQLAQSFRGRGQNV